MKRIIAMSLIGLLLCGFSTKAFSYWGGHYHYREGRYYRDAGWWGFGGLFTGLAVGAYVASLPQQYETVYIEGVPYYYADGYYYQTSPNGYVVVTPPASASQGQAIPTGNNVMVYILEILFGILLLFGIAVLLKRLLVKEHKPA